MRANPNNWNMKVKKIFPHFAWTYRRYTPLGNAFSSGRTTLKMFPMGLRVKKPCTYASLPQIRVSLSAASGTVSSPDSPVFLQYFLTVSCNFHLWLPAICPHTQPISCIPLHWPEEDQHSPIKTWIKFACAVQSPTTTIAVRLLESCKKAVHFQV